MGIEVFEQNRQKTVTLTDAHEKRVVTAIDKNPTRSSIGDVMVHNVFRRTKTGDAERDGNPLIYALKELQGFTITPFWRGRIMTRAGQIIEKMTVDLAAFDFILPVPSSNPLCADFGALVSGKVGVPCMEPTFIRKKTADEILADFDGIPAGVRKQDRQAFGRQLREWEGLPKDSKIAMKIVDRAIRRFVDPFTTEGEIPSLQRLNVLIVDDLHSSGASIASVAKILKGQGAMVSAICFLSAV